MAKYDAEFKFQVVQAYLDGKGGYRIIAKRFGIPNKSLVEQWVRQYKEFGYKGIERRKKKKKYSMNFKMDVLNYYYQSGLSLLDVAVKFDIPSPTRIRSWEKEYSAHGIDGLKPKQKGRPFMSKQSKRKIFIPKKMTREQELEHENELLRAELAFIKKLRALGMNIPNRLKNEMPESSTPSEKNSN